MGLISCVITCIAMPGGLPGHLAFYAFSSMGSAGGPKLHRQRMKASIEIADGKVTLKVYYDPARCNWDEAIAAGLASFGLKRGQAAVLALPIPNPVGTGRAGRMRILGLNRD
jgi:hypothetical protein